MDSQSNTLAVGPLRIIHFVSYPRLLRPTTSPAFRRDKTGVGECFYFADGATLFGDLAKGIYQYDGQAYKGQFTHGDLGPTECKDCHNVHELQVQVDVCGQCHQAVETLEDL